MTAWRDHVKATMAGNPELKAKEGLKGILKLASKTYKKGVKAVEGKPDKKTRRHHKKAHKKHHKKTSKKHTAKRRRRRTSKKHHKRKSRGRK